MRRSTRLREARACQWRNEGRIATQGPAERRRSVDHEIQAAAIVCRDARRGGVNRFLNSSSTCEPMQEHAGQQQPHFFSFPGSNQVEVASSARCPCTGPNQAQCHIECSAKHTFAKVQGHPKQAARPRPVGTTNTCVDCPFYRGGVVQPGPPDNLAAGSTNSWLFAPLLHAAVGRLHPSALTAWEGHDHYALLWRGALGTLRHAPPVALAALVHALHTLPYFTTARRPRRTPCR